MKTKKLLLFLDLFFLFCFSFFCFHFALAKTLQFSPNISLGPFKAGQSVSVPGDFTFLKEYIIAIYKFIIGLSAILAVIVIAIGGIIWATAAGSAGQVSKAKGLITGSLFGLVLTLLSYSLLSAVNSDITNLDFQGATVNEIANKAVAGCKWQTSKCDKNTQIDRTSEGAMYCPANGNKTGDEYCCCKRMKVKNVCLPDLHIKCGVIDLKDNCVGNDCSDNPLMPGYIVLCKQNSDNEGNYYSGGKCIYVPSTDKYGGNA